MQLVEQLAVHFAAHQAKSRDSADVAQVCAVADMFVPFALEAGRVF